MLARLTVHQADRPARRIVLDRNRRYLIGRDEACTIHIEDDSVSRRHAKLVHEGGAWRLSDLCSKNGTRIGGKPVGEHDPDAGDWIEFGMVLACFDRMSPESVAAERRHLAERWSTSIEMGRDLEPSLDARELLRRTLESFVELSAAERGFIMLREAGGELRADVCHPSEHADFRGSRSVVDRAVRETRSIVCSDVRFDPALRGQASIAGGDVSALACVPLRVGSEVLGAIYVDSRLPGKQFTEQEVEILQALANHAALVIGVARLRETIVDLSSMLPPQLDPANPPQKSFMEELQRQLAKFWQDSGAVVTNAP